MGTPDPREVLQLASAVVEAENRLKRLRADWDALFASSKGHDESRGTLSERIAQLVNSNFTQTFSAPQVSAQLGANPNSVGPLLSRLVSEGKIRKVGHGEYRGFTPDVVLEQTEGPEALPS